MDVPAHVSRRVFGALTLLGAAGLGVSGCAGRPKPTAGAMPIQKIAYGDDPSQFGELYLPTGDRRVGTVVVIHGGFWLSGYGLDLGAPLAQDLAERGWVAWNIEYRRIGNGGGWPATVADVAAAVDHLSVLAESGDHGKIDLGHVVAVGHSAGGHLAGWLAGRPKLPAGAPGSDPSVKITGVVSQAGVLDLAVAADTHVGGDAVPQLVGGSPENMPDRYRLADPIQQLPIGVPVHCVHSPDDGNVPYQQSTAYVAAAVQTGDPAVLHQVSGDHFTLIDVSAAAWQVVVDTLPLLFGT